MMLKPKPYPALTTEKASEMPMYNIFGNICMVNYVLAGIQNCFVDQCFKCGIASAPGFADYPGSL